MDVLMLSRSVIAHGIGGMETYIELLGEEFSRMGHSLTVLTTSRPRQDPKEPRKATAGRAGAGEGPFGGPGESGRPGDVEKRQGARYVFLDGTPPGVYSNKWWSASRAAFSVRAPDVVFSNSIGAYGILGAVRRRRMPMIAKCHGTAVTDALTTVRTFGLRTNPAHLLRTLSYTPHHMRVYSESRRVIAVSHPIARHLATLGLLPPSKITVVLDGVDTRRFTPGDGAGEREQLLGDNGGPVIFTMARVVKEKGFHFVLRAMPAILREHPGARLVIGGEGTFLPRLRAMARELGVEGRVTFTGRIPADALPSYYRACDVFALATTFVEGFGIVLAEAMACGRPVAASRIGGIPEVVRDGETGLLFEPGDQRGVTASLLELLSDEGRRRRMGEAARQDAERRFGSRRMAQETLDVLRAACSGG